MAEDAVEEDGTGEAAAVKVMTVEGVAVGVVAVEDVAVEGSEM
jgi:hypothetical protein